MADCVVCSYPLIHIAEGNLVDLKFNDDPEAKEVMEKHDIEVQEGETPVGCYACPMCGACVWLEN